MSARDFADGVADLLVNDATFAAAITALIGQNVTRVLRSNTPLQQVFNGAHPCFVIEQGDGQAASISNDGDDFLTIGGSEQHFETTLEIALCWQQQDRDAAAQTRADLPERFAQLFLRNPQPGGVFSAWLESWSPDRGGLHPNHVWAATVRGQFIIQRD